MTPVKEPAMVRGPSQPTVKPRLEALEDRTVPATIFTHFVHGGAALEVNHVLFIGVVNAKLNTVQITDIGKGRVEVWWNTSARYIFTGVNEIVVAAAGKVNDVTFTLAGKLTGPLELDLFLHGQSSFREQLNAPTYGNLSVQLHNV
jgi:hypothetical protein